jgi:hypothetical protein
LASILSLNLDPIHFIKLLHGFHLIFGNISIPIEVRKTTRLQNENLFGNPR